MAHKFFVACVWVAAVACILIYAMVKFCNFTNLSFPWESTVINTILGNSYHGEMRQCT